jgi:hypothetical protein
VLTTKQMKKTVRTDDGHLLWTGACANGYPGLKRGNQTFYVKRLHWEERHGPVPPGAVVISTCGLRACIEPEHLALRAPGRYTAGARDPEGRFTTEPSPAT